MKLTKQQATFNILNDLPANHWFWHTNKGFTRQFAMIKLMHDARDMNADNVIVEWYNLIQPYLDAKFFDRLEVK